MCDVCVRAGAFAPVPMTHSWHGHMPLPHKHDMPLCTTETEMIYLMYEIKRIGLVPNRHHRTSTCTDIHVHSDIDAEIRDGKYAEIHDLHLSNWPTWPHARKGTHTHAHAHLWSENRFLAKRRVNYIFFSCLAHSGDTRLGVICHVIQPWKSKMTFPTMNVHDWTGYVCVTHE